MVQAALRDASISFCDLRVQPHSFSDQGAICVHRSELEAAERLLRNLAASHAIKEVREPTVESISRGDDETEDLATVEVWSGGPAPDGADILGAI